MIVLHMLQASQFCQGLQEVSGPGGLARPMWSTQASRREIITAMQPVLPEDIIKKLAGELAPLIVAAWRDATSVSGFSDAGQKQVSMLLLLLLLQLPQQQLLNVTVYLWCSS